MTVGDLIALLGGDSYIVATDNLFVLNRNKLVVGRGPLVVAEIDVAKGIVTKGVGVSLDADACGAATANGGAQ